MNLPKAKLRNEGDLRVKLDSNVYERSLNRSQRRSTNVKWFRNRDFPGDRT
jgi:hypothetical protein